MRPDSEEGSGQLPLPPRIDFAAEHRAWAAYFPKLAVGMSNPSSIAAMNAKQQQLEAETSGEQRAALDAAWQRYLCPGSVQLWQYAKTILPPISLWSFQFLHPSVVYPAAYPHSLPPGLDFLPNLQPPLCGVPAAAAGQQQQQQPPGACSNAAAAGQQRQQQPPDACSNAAAAGQQQQQQLPGACSNAAAAGQQRQQQPPGACSNAAAADSLQGSLSDLSGSELDLELEEQYLPAFGVCCCCSNCCFGDGSCCSNCCFGDDGFTSSPESELVQPGKRIKWRHAILSSDPVRRVLFTSSTLQQPAATAAAAAAHLLPVGQPFTTATAATPVSPAPVQLPAAALLAGPAKRTRSLCNRRSVLV
ncbi:hypothetical protein ACK3TF_001944 [Chlorella vulgaris]